MKSTKTLFLVILSIILCFFQTNRLVAQKSKSKVQLPQVGQLSKDMAEMLVLFEGEFDNFGQAYKEKEDKAPEPHENIHSIFKRVDAKAFGPNTFYVMQYFDGDEKKIYRQRLYSFSENVTENAIQLDIYSFKTDTLFYNSHKNPEKLIDLKADMMTSTQGCAVYWKNNGTDFIGYMKDKACNFVSKRSGKKIFITDSLKLNKNEIWICDQATDEEGKYVFGHKLKIPHKLKRCIKYKGWVSLQKAGYENEYEYQKDIILHDQGQKVRIYSNEGKPLKYSFELSNVVYGKDVEVLKLAIYEDGKDKALIYTWAEPGAKRVGVNLRWLQIGLTKID